MTKRLMAALVAVAFWFGGQAYGATNTVETAGGGGGGAPTNAQYYTAAANSELSAEFVPAANVRSILSAADYAAIRTLLDLEAGTDFNAYDADLATWATVTPSANGKSLVAAADYSAMRTALSLVPGTNVQAYNASLAAIAAGTWTGASSITTLGTIATGVWNGTAIGSDKITEADPLALKTAGTDNVKDTHIDWGSGAGQVNTDDISQGSTNLWSTLGNIQSACTNDFHNIGGTDANTTYIAGTGMSLVGTTFNCTVVDTNTTYTGGTGIGLTGTTFSLAPGEVDALTWGTADYASFDWTFNLIANDPTISFGPSLFQTKCNFHVGGDDAVMYAYIHDAGTLTFYDNSDDTTVVLGPVDEDGTTLTVNGSLAPNADSSRLLGTSVLQWLAIYTDELKSAGTMLLTATGITATTTGGITSTDTTVSASGQGAWGFIGTTIAGTPKVWLGALGGYGALAFNVSESASADGYPGVTSYGTKSLVFLGQNAYNTFGFAAQGAAGQQLYFLIDPSDGAASIAYRFRAYFTAATDRYMATWESGSGAAATVVASIYSNGGINTANGVYPMTDGACALGTAALMWKEIYVLDVNLGDAGGFSGFRFNAGTTQVEVYMDGVLLGHFDATGYVDEV